MWEVSLVVLLIASLIVVIYAYYSTFAEVPDVLFESNSLVLSGQNVFVENIPRKYLYVKNHGVPKGTLIAYLVVQNKKTGNTWRYFIEPDQEWCIEVPGEVVIYLEGTSIKYILST